MNIKAKKIVVLLPVLALTVLYLKDHYRFDYQQAGANRLVVFSITILLLYLWIIRVVIKRRQDSYWQMLLQSSFFVYVFIVLTLTGYFILFREISYHGWWQKMIHRVESRDHVNLELFKIFRIYKITDTQIIGNFLMLLPLGIYLPLLYRKIPGFLGVTLVSFLVAVFIELLQLATSFRSTDVDDVLLNTVGASTGFVLYLLWQLLFTNFPLQKQTGAN